MDIQWGTNTFDRVLYLSTIANRATTVPEFSIFEYLHAGFHLGVQRVNFGQNYSRRAKIEGYSHRRNTKGAI